MKTIIGTFLFVVFAFAAQGQSLSTLPFEISAVGQPSDDLQNMDARLLIVSKENHLVIKDLIVDNGECVPSQPIPANYVVNKSYGFMLTFHKPYGNCKAKTVKVITNKGDWVIE